MYFNNAFAKYTSELAKERYNPLPVAKERFYLEEYKFKNCNRSFGRLVESYLRFVIYVLKDFRIADTVNIMDVVQEGNLGLMESIKNFDITRKSRVGTYGVFWIRFYITKFIKPPDNTKVIHYYTCITHGGNFLTNGKCIFCKTQLTPVKRPIISPFPEDDNFEIIENGIMDQAAADIVKVLFNNTPGLSEREKFILIQFFGLQPPYHPKTLQEIGSMLHLNFERIRQVKEGALKKLNRDSISHLVSV